MAVGWKGLTSVASLAAFCSSVPVFFLGVIAVQVQADLGISPQRIGVAVGSYFAAGALTSRFLGGIGDRFSPGRTVAASLVLTVVSCVLMGSVATTWAALCGLMILAGVGNGLASPALAAVVLSTVPHARVGLSFGIKQASVAATMSVAGFAVPTLVIVFGWRSLFLCAAVIVLGSALLMQLLSRARQQSTGSTAPPEGWELSPLTRAGTACLVSGFGIGMAIATGMLAYATNSAVGMGLSESAAGLLVGASGAGAVAVRVLSGWAVDRQRFDHLGLGGGLMVLGSVGLATLAVQQPWAACVGFAMAFAFGWGWVGLMIYAVADLNRHRPAAASGIAQSAAATGGLLGPLVVGQLLANVGERVSWVACGAALALAAALVLATRRSLRSPARSAARAAPGAAATPRSG